MTWFTYISKWQSDFARVLFSWNFALAKFGENKPLAKVFKSTVCKFHSNNELVLYFPLVSQLDMKPDIMKSLGFPIGLPFYYIFCGNLPR